MDLMWVADVLEWNWPSVLVDIPKHPANIWDLIKRVDRMTDEEEEAMEVHVEAITTEMTEEAITIEATTAVTIDVTIDEMTVAMIVAMIVVRGTTIPPDDINT